MHSKSGDGICRPASSLVQERVYSALGDLPAMACRASPLVHPGESGWPDAHCSGQVVRGLLRGETFHLVGCVGVWVGPPRALPWGATNPVPARRSPLAPGRTGRVQGDGSTTTWSSTAASISRRWPTSKLFHAARGDRPP